MANPEHLAILEQGVEVWNQWRRDNPDIEMDLKRSYLISFDLRGANLSGIDLSYANLTNSQLAHADLSQTKLTCADLSNTDFMYTDFRNANLSRVNFKQRFLGYSNFDSANLSGAILSKTDLRGSTFRNAILQGTNFESANLSGAILLDADLSDTNFTNANLSGTSCINADFSNAQLSEAYLSKLDARSGNLSSLDLSATNFSNANLESADLSYSDLTDSNLEYADLSNVNLRYAVLRNVSIKGAKFYNTNLVGTDLSRFDFNEVNLIGVDLSHVNLTTIQALRANFREANLTGACIEDWHINSQTNLEDVVCDYIYQKLEWQDSKLVFSERLPHDPNRNFEAGEFTRLFQQALKTVNLIFNDGIDWEAFLESFQGLQIEAESSELGIQAIEKKWDGSFVVKVDVPASFDKGEIEKAFFRKYKKALNAKTAEYRQLLRAKDEEIKAKDSEIIQLYRERSTDLTEVVKLLASRQNIINNQANAMASDSINQSGNFGVGVNQGEISGNAKVAGTLNEAQRQDLAEATKEIQAILNQLEETYPTETVPQQVEVANQALQRIEQTPTLKRKLLSAGEEAGIAAIEKALDNPAGVFLTTFLKSMLEAERKK